MRSLIVVLALVFAAAAPVATAQGVTRFDAGSNGAEAMLAPGEIIVIALDVVGAQDGHAWFVKQVPECVDRTGELVACAALESSDVEVARTYMFRFQARRACSGDIVLERRTRDGADETAHDVYRLSVRVAAAP